MPMHQRTHASPANGSPCVSKEIALAAWESPLVISKVDESNWGGSHQRAVASRPSWVAGEVRLRTVRKLPARACSIEYSTCLDADVARAASEPGEKPVTDHNRIYGP
jgi:hypothetical protein